MNLPAILAQLTALELAIDMRRIDNERTAIAAHAAYARGDDLTAEQWASWYWTTWEARMVPIASWDTERGVA